MAASEQELQELEKILTRWNASFDAVRPIFDVKEKQYEKYRFKRDPNTHTYKYNVSLPIIFTQIENVNSTIVNSFFQKTKIIDIQPVEGFNFTRPEIQDEQLAIQTTRAVNLLINNPDNNFYNGFNDAVKTACIYGKGYTTVTPRFDFEDPDNPVYQGFMLNARDFFDIIPSTNAIDLRTSRYKFLRETVSTDELKERAERDPHYKKSRINEIPNTNWIPEEIRKTTFDTIGPHARRSAAVDDKSNTILILHYFEDGHIVTIAANSVIIRDTRDAITIQTALDSERIVQKPFTYDIFDEIDLIRVPREYFSIGISEILEQIQDLMNIRRSQRLENIELVLQKPVLINYNFDFDIDNLFFAPGNLILSNNISESAIREFNFSDITGSSYREDEIDMLIVQDASGMSDAARGQSSHSRETATGIVQLQRAALKRAETSIKGISINWLRSVARKILIQIRTYMSQQEYERLIGQPDAGLFRLSIKEIMQMLDIMPVSTSLDQIREQEQQSFIQAMQTLLQIPEANRPEFIKMYIELFHPNKNPNRFVIQPPVQQPGQPPPGQAPPGQAPTGQAPTGIVAQPGSPKIQTPGSPTISPDDLIRLAGQGRLGGQQGRT